MSSNMQTEADSNDTGLSVGLDPSPPCVTQADNGNAQTRRRSMRVLIVDDEECVADALCALVSSWGHDVRKSYGGDSGLADAGRQLPQVVLLDIEMPGMDGYELARRLRLRADLRGCYIIAMRAPGDFRGSARMESSVDLFLAKPMNVSVLETLIQMEGERLDRLT
jgi:CheY-like chemotaxis protein